MPRKVFTAGEVLAAADVNNFLMDQTVMTFTSGSARSSAIGTATEGMLSYLQDSNSFQYWNGSSWSNLLAGSPTTITTAYTATSADSGNLLYSTSSSAITVTVPDVLDLNSRIDIIRDGAGTVTIAAGSGVTSWAGKGTAGTAVTFKIDEQYNAATVFKVAANTYRVVGKIAI